jgi:hypothetical protein
MAKHEKAFVCEGKSGVTVEFNNGRVIIRHPRGFRALLDHQRGKGDKEIPISSITAIQLKPVGWATSGYIQFAYPGSTETKGGVLDAVKDENTVMFDKKQQPRFEELKNRILEAKNSVTNATPPVPIKAQVARRNLRNSTSPVPTKAQEIRELSKLLDDGILSEEEFASAKRRLLS